MRNFVIKLLGLVFLTSFTFGANAQVNLSAETAGPTGVPGNVMGHMADVLGEKKIANLHKNVIVEVKKCDLKWCKVKIRNFNGWINKRDIWGIEINEIF